MIGMGDDDKSIGTLLLAIGGKKEEKPKEDPYDSVLTICAERFVEAVKAGDVEAVIKELPKLIAVLPSPEFGESEED